MLSKKEEYLTKYSSIMEDSINKQLKEINDSFIKELKKQKKFNKVSQLAEFSKNYKFTIDLNDSKTKVKLEQSLAEPVVFENAPAISTLGVSLPTQPDYGYFGFAGRVITHALYTDVYSTYGYTADGDYYQIYDVTNYMYSWSGNSTYGDRINHVWSGVKQTDPLIWYNKVYNFDTGFPSYRYSDSFSKSGSAINLDPGCHVSGMGGASNGAYAEAVFGGCSDIMSDSLNNNYGGIVWYATP